MTLKFVLFSSLVPLAYPLPQIIPLSPLVTTDTLHNYLRREFSSLERGDKTNAEEEEFVEGRWKAKLNRMKENSQMKIGSFPSGMEKDDEIRRLAKNRKNDGAGKNGKSDKGKKNGEDKSDKGEGKGKDDKGKSKNGKADDKSNGKNDKKEKKNDKKEKKEKNDKGKDNNSPSTVTPPSRTLDLSLSTCDLYCDGLDAFCESLEDCCEEGFAVCDAAVFDEPGYYHCGAKTEYLGRCVEDEVIQHVVNAPPCELFCDGKPTTCDYGHHNCCESGYTLCDASTLKGYSDLLMNGFEEDRYSCGKVSTYSKDGKCDDKPPPPTVYPTLRPSTAPPTTFQPTSSSPSTNPTSHPTGPTPSPTPVPTRFVMDLSHPHAAFPTVHPEPSPPE